MRPDVETFFDPATFTATFLVSDPATGAAAIIDPVLDYEPKGASLSTGSADAVLAAVAERGLDLQWVLETHAHADHLTAADYIRRKTGAKIGVGARIVEVQQTFIPMFEADDIQPDGAVFDRLFDDGETFLLGELPVTVIATPGHTSADVTFLAGDAAFIGDTMFMPDYGTARTDFPGGDAAALYHSIRRILALPPQTRLFVGHDYLPEGRTAYRWETSVAEQRRDNVHIRDGVTEEAFVALRKGRDAGLAKPVLIMPALQVNIRAGALPPPSADGRRRLKIPLSGAV